ncbi:MAG TPA: DUF6427 family protein [Parafilimonas sp.]|nr:DUF6427 family protein [Parafilimonas sp.]
MVSFFKDKSAVAVFWLVLVCFGLHVHSLVTPPQVTISPADGFFYYVLNPLRNADTYFASLLYVFIIFVLALQLNFVLNSLHMFPRPSFTPALAFVLLSALLPAFNDISSALFACNFVIWILYQACKLYAAPNAKTSIFNLGLLAGLSVVLYYPSLPLILIIIIALAIIRPFNLNEWFVLFFGAITPAYFLIIYLFLTDKFSLLPLPRAVFDLVKLPLQPFSIITSLIVAALVIIWGIFSVKNSRGNVLIQVRKSWAVFFASLLLFIPVVFFMNGAYPSVLLLAAIPAACYTGFAFAGNRNIVPVVFFWVLAGLAVYNNWFAKY